MAKYQVRVSYSQWQEGMSEAEAVQVVMEGIPDIATHVRAEVVSRIKNPLELQPIEEEKKNEQANQHSAGAR